MMKWIWFSACSIALCGSLLICRYLVAEDTGRSVPPQVAEAVDFTNPLDEMLDRFAPTSHGDLGWEPYGDDPFGSVSLDGDLFAQGPPPFSDDPEEEGEGRRGPPDGEFGPPREGPPRDGPPGEGPPRRDRRGRGGQFGPGPGGPGERGPRERGPRERGPGGPGGEGNFEGGPRGPGGGPPGGRPPHRRGPGGMGMGLQHLEQQDPEMYQLLKEDRDLERETRDLAHRFRRAPTDERDALREDIAELVNKHFDVRQQRRTLELERLRKELERLEGSMSRRSEAREAIVHRRIAELVGDEDELDF